VIVMMILPRHPLYQHVVMQKLDGIYPRRLCSLFEWVSFSLERGMDTGSYLELPILVGRLNRPLEFISQGLCEDLLNGDVIFLAEHDSETGVDIILLGD